MNYKNEKVQEAFYIYRHIKNYQVDRPRIFSLCYQALKEGEKEAADLLALIYMEEEICSRDGEKARGFLALSKDLEDTEGLYIWAEEIKIDDPSFALKLYSKAAKKDYPPALREFGRALYYISPKKSEELLKKAAKLGNVKALHDLGVIYESFKRYLNDHLEIAFKYFLKAAELNDEDSRMRVGIMYDFGRGVKVNHVKAREYYDSFMSNSFSIYYDVARGFIGRQRLYGLGNEEKDEKLGFLTMLNSVNEYRMYPEILHEIVRCYETGVGTEKDLEKAEEYSRLLAEWSYKNLANKNW